MPKSRSRAKNCKQVATIKTTVRSRTQVCPNRKQNFTLKEKLAILDEIDKKVSVSDLADIHGVSYQTIASIKSKTEELRVYEEGGGDLEAKRIEVRMTYPELDREVLRFLEMARQKRFPVRPTFLIDVASFLARRLGITTFKASWGWYESFCKRHNVFSKVLCGEAASVDLVALKKWMDVDLQDLLRLIDPKNVVNADETGVFWRDVGSRTLVFGRNNEKGIKLAKDRITILMVCSAYGEMFEPVMIGTAEQPHAFTANATFRVNDYRNDYGFSYYFNKTAWMTKLIFDDWVNYFNEQMKKLDRHVVLLLDNFSGHNVASRSNVQVWFFPPNLTTHVQPCDAGIIKSFKDHFRTQMNNRVFECIESVSRVEDFVKQVTVFDACDWSLKALKSVKQSTIRNCFRKCGIVYEGEVASEVASAVVVEDDVPAVCITQGIQIILPLMMILREKYCFNSDIKIAGLLLRSVWMYFVIVTLYFV